MLWGSMEASILFSIRIMYTKVEGSCQGCSRGTTMVGRCYPKLLAVTLCYPVVGSKTLNVTMPSHLALQGTSLFLTSVFPVTPVASEHPYICIVFSVFMIMKPRNQFLKFLSPCSQHSLCVPRNGRIFQPEPTEQDVVQPASCHTSKAPCAYP